MDFVSNFSFGGVVEVFLGGFYLLFAVLYLVYSLVYLSAIKALNRTVITPHAWFFNLFSLVQVLLGILLIIFGFSFFF